MNLRIPRETAHKLNRFVNPSLDPSKELAWMVCARARDPCRTSASAGLGR
jgi:hypothetical protein